MMQYYFCRIAGVVLVHLFRRLFQGFHVHLGQISVVKEVAKVCVCVCVRASLRACVHLYPWQRPTPAEGLPAGVSSNTQEPP